MEISQPRHDAAEELLAAFEAVLEEVRTAQYVTLFFYTIFSQHSTAHTVLYHDANDFQCFDTCLLTKMIRN